MTSYLLIKSIHITTVILSLAGFITRAYWRFFLPDKLQSRRVKILPHINDTVLLLSAILLAIMLRQYPFTHGWLTAKVLLLLLYILAGSITLKTGFSRRASLSALLVSLCSFALIISIALFHRY